MIFYKIASWYLLISFAALLLAFIISKILRIHLSNFLKVSSKKLRIDHTQAKNLIVIFKPFRVNDLVDVGSLPKGRVEDITLRHTVIRNFENRRLIIPNSVISSEVVVNSSIVEESICNFLDIGISYDSDIDRAMEIMRSEAMAHPDFMDNRSDEEKENDEHPVSVRVMGFGDSSVNLRAFVWTLDHTSGFNLKTDLNKSIKEAFDKEGIEIPFPYRTIVYKKDI